MAESDLSTEGGTFEKLPGGESGVDAYRFVPTGSQPDEPQAKPDAQPQEPPAPGVDTGGYVRRLFQIESGGNPNAVTGSNRGLGQFGPTEEHMYGLNDANRHLPEAQASAVMLERAHNDPTLTRVLGREPTHAEHYLAHQQGLAGATALLGNPDTPAWQAIRPYYRSDAIAQRAITGNIPGDSPLKRLNVNDISSAGFTAMWRDKFNRGLSPTSETQMAEYKGKATPAEAEGWGTIGGSGTTKGQIEKNLQSGPMLVPKTAPGAKEFLKDNPDVEYKDYEDHWLILPFTPPETAPLVGQVKGDTRVAGRTARVRSSV
jgi:hypothetical protein